MPRSLRYDDNVSFVCPGVMVAQYLQNVTQRLSLGSELLYQYGQTVPGNEIAIYTLAGRYTGMSHVSYQVVVNDIENFEILKTPMTLNSPFVNKIAGRSFKMYKAPSTGFIITFIFIQSSCWTYY